NATCGRAAKRTVGAVAFGLSEKSNGPAMLVVLHGRASTAIV
ncbi:hypothetical protein CISIN_1g0371561mg, partial [Citrus sinensis]